MYAAEDDPYCYPDTSVLKNRLDLRTQAELADFEAAITAQRADERLPAGNLDDPHYCAIHHHLFQDIYDWAGKLRTVRIAKQGSAFCYPENIEREMKRLFEWLEAENHLRDLDPETFAAKAAHFLAELNAIHPFREGNGRTQNVFLLILADRADHSLHLGRLNPSDMIQAMVASFVDDEQPLASLIRSLMRMR